MKKIDYCDVDTINQELSDKEGGLTLLFQDDKSGIFRDNFYGSEYPFIIKDGILYNKEGEDSWGDQFFVQDDFLITKRYSDNSSPSYSESIEGISSFNLKYTIFSYETIFQLDGSYLVRDAKTGSLI